MKAIDAFPQWKGGQSLPRCIFTGYLHYSYSSHHLHEQYSLIFNYIVIHLLVVSYIIYIILFMKAIDAFPPVERRPICAQWDIYRLFTPQQQHIQRGSHFFLEILLKDQQKRKKTTSHILEISRIKGLLRTKHKDLANVL